MSTRTPGLWKVMSVYFLIYLLISIAISLLYGLLILFFLRLPALNTPTWVWNVATFFLPFVIVFVGTKYAARFLKRKYELLDTKKIALFATYLQIALALIFLLRNIFIRDIGGVPIVRHHAEYVISSSITILLFYILSLKFLEEKR